MARKRKNERLNTDKTDNKKDYLSILANIVVIIQFLADIINKIAGIW